jgi:two-component system nitrate/nitrite response regulator NarL
MANSSITLKDIPYSHRPLAERAGYSASKEANEIKPSYKETGLEKGSDDQSVVTVLIEPNALLREGLRSVLAETRYNPVAMAASLEEVGSIPVLGDGVRIFIMGVVEDYDGACRQVKGIKDRNPSDRVVMLADKYELQTVVAAFHSGADAYLIQSISREVLLKTLDLVILGEPVYPAETIGSLRSKSPVLDPTHSRILTCRELAILRCLMDGNPNKVIARKLEIAEATVKVHIKTILRKIRVKNRTQAAVWGVSHLELDDGAPARDVSST